MDKKELIEKLEWSKAEKDKIICAQEAIGNATNYYKGKSEAFNYAIYLAKKLDEPTHEPVEVEPFVADWLDSLEEREKGKDYLIYELVFAAVEDAEYELDQMEEWVGKEGNIFTLADALRYGYVRKPEKQWVVIKDNGHWKMYLKSYSSNSDSEFVNYKFDWEKNGRLVFTDKAKAEAVATLVEGEVEEV